MPSPVRVPIDPARPPWQLVPELDGSGVHALDAGAAEGWRTPPGSSGSGESLLACEPEVVFAGGLEALGAARSWLSAWRGADPDAALLLGCLGYELGSAFERLPDSVASEPVDALPPVRLAGFRAVYRYRAGGGGEVVGSDARAVARLAERIRAAAAAVPCPTPPRLPDPEPRTPDAEYHAAIARIQRWIRAGDVYQVNLSRRLDLRPVEPAIAPLLYSRLCATSPAPFAAYLDLASHRVVSNSPERFLRALGRRVETCPIKGTRPRAGDPEHDALLAKELCRSEKDRAEHVMIVDLERNDLGRVCRTGSISVPRLAELRSFTSVHHLVSSVQGELVDPDNWPVLLAATFPGGSITGAPKLRAMEIIRAVEPVRRGVYTGAIGCFDAAGGVDLSIAIRTAVASGDGLHLHLGGGIVADSEPAAELAETHHKGAVFSALWEAA